MLILGGCYTGPSADHFEAVLDELAIPKDWDLAKSDRQGPDEEVTCDPFVSTGCPHAIRFYLTGGDIHEAYSQATDIVTRAGFGIEGGAACLSGSSTGPGCGFIAERSGDMLDIQVLSSPGEAGLGNELPTAVTVMVLASSSR
jgi:hypothetical protein